jgi:hypothetical protein
VYLIQGKIHASSGRPGRIVERQPPIPGFFSANRRSFPGGIGFFFLLKEVKNNVSDVKKRGTGEIIRQKNISRFLYDGYFMSDST